MADKISYGARGMLVFPITGTVGGVPTYGTPTIWGGLREVSFSTTSSTDTVYADDVPWDVTVTASSGELTVKHFTVPLAVKQAILGVVVDPQKARVYGLSVKKACGIAWQSREKDDAGVITDTLHIIYSATFEDPEISNKTREDKTEAQEFETKATTSAVKFSGLNEAIQYVELRRSEVGDTVYDSALNTMFIPTSI